MSLLESTQKLLKERRRFAKLRDIAESSEGAVEREWLYRFARNEIPDPSVNRIQALHDFLKTYKPKNNA